MFGDQGCWGGAETMRSPPLVRKPARNSTLTFGASTPATLVHGQGRALAKGLCGRRLRPAPGSTVQAYNCPQRTPPGCSLGALLPNGFVKKEKASSTARSDRTGRRKILTPCASSSDSEITRTAAASHRTGVAGAPSAALSHRLTFSIAGTKVAGFCLPVSVYRVGP